MGAGHGSALPGSGGPGQVHTLIHRAPAHVKILVLLAFVLTVVATPREWFPVFGGYLAAILGVALLLARIPFRWLAKRMVIEVPFLVFAALMPFVVRGPEVQVLGIALSEPGLLAAWGLAAKGTLGVLASLTLAATTEPVAVLAGLQRLRMPDLIVQIMGFMVRYLSVVAGDLQRMLTAMRSRGADPRSPRHWPALARTLGALFVRSYERGERVHLAMLSRGYDGRLP